MPRLTLVEGINLALARAMEADPAVVVLGEDVGRNGGVFRATAGLQARFGEGRVADTPLAEGLIAGMAVGMAAEGLKPVAEIQFAGFAYAAIDQLLNHASRLRHRTQGRLSCPMVLRTPCGAGIHAPEHHSESPEAMFAHIPGLRVVTPSSPARAYGLLLAAIADPDPVVFLEPSRLYRRFKEEIEDDGEVSLQYETAIVTTTATPARISSLNFGFRTSSKTETRSSITQARLWGSPTITSARPLRPRASIPATEATCPSARARCLPKTSARGLRRTMRAWLPRPFIRSATTRSSPDSATIRSSSTLAPSSICWRFVPARPAIWAAA